MTFLLAFYPEHSAFTLSLILLVAFAGVAGCGDRQFPRRHGQPAGLGGGSLRRPAREVRHGGLHRRQRKHPLHGNATVRISSGGNSKVSCFGKPRGCHHGPVSGWIATSPAVQNHGVSAKQAPGSSSFVSCQICQAGATSPAAGAKVSWLPLPWCERAASGSALARSHVHPHKYEHGKRAGLRAVPLPGVPRTTRRATRPRPPRRERRPGCFNSTLCATTR